MLVEDQYARVEHFSATKGRLAPLNMVLETGRFEALRAIQ